MNYLVTNWVMKPEVHLVCVRYVVGSRGSVGPAEVPRGVAARVDTRAVGTLSGNRLAQIVIPQRSRYKKRIRIHVRGIVKPGLTDIGVGDDRHAPRIVGYLWESRRIGVSPQDAIHQRRTGRVIVYTAPVSGRIRRDSTIDENRRYVFAEHCPPISGCGPIGIHQAVFESGTILACIGLVMDRAAVACVGEIAEKNASGGGDIGVQNEHTTTSVTATFVVRKSAAGE